MLEILILLLIAKEDRAAKRIDACDDATFSPCPPWFTGAPMPPVILRPESRWHRWLRHLGEVLWAAIRNQIFP
jgi:hypothetical protein